MKIKKVHYYKDMPYREIDINLNLYGIPNKRVKEDSDESYSLSEQQEQFVKKELQRVFPNLEWKTTQELLGGKFDAEANRILGDINAMHPVTKELICIDLKVSRPPLDEYSEIGTGVIHQSSIMGFARNINHYYLSVTPTGHDYIMVPGVDIYNIYLKTACLIPVENKKTRLYYKINDSKYITNKKPAFSCGSDYMPSFVFYPRYVKRKRF